MKLLYGIKPYEIDIKSPLIEEKSQDSNYCCELKYNGWRVQLVSDDTGHCSFYSTSGRNLNLNLSDLIIKPNTQIDCEWVNNRTKDVKNQLRPFSILRYDSEICEMNEISRRNLLQEIFPDSLFISGMRIDLIERFNTDFIKVFHQYRDNKLIEGIVIKKLDANLEYSYKKQIKTVTWLKIKK